MDDDSSREDQPFYEVRIIGTGVIVTRTNRRYSSIREVSVSFSDIEAGIRNLDTTVCSLLVDLRPIVGRNDTEFETALGPLRRALLRRFSRAAFIVRTTIGKLQLERYLASDSLDAAVFDDNDDARRWLESAE